MKAEISVKVAIEVTDDKKKTFIFKRRSKEMEAIIQGFLSGLMEEIKKQTEKFNKNNHGR